MNLHCESWAVKVAKICVVIFVMVISQSSYADVFDHLDPSVEFKRAAFVGFINVESTQSEQGGVRATASVRKSLKGAEAGDTLTFFIPFSDDLINDHDQYLAILHLSDDDADWSLRAYAYQAVFADYCSEGYEDCQFLVRRSSVFTQGNLLSVDGLIDAFAVVDNSIHALVNWRVAKSQLLRNSEDEKWD